MLQMQLLRLHIQKNVNRIEKLTPANSILPSIPFQLNTVTNLMDLFRAVQKKEEYSERVLELIEELLELNAGNYTVWYIGKVFNLA